MANRTLRPAGRPALRVASAAFRIAAVCVLCGLLGVGYTGRRGRFLEAGTGGSGQRPTGAVCSLSARERERDPRRRGRFLEAGTGGCGQRPTGAVRSLSARERELAAAPSPPLRAVSGSRDRRQRSATNGSVSFSIRAVARTGSGAVAAAGARTGARAVAGAAQFWEKIRLKTCVWGWRFLQ